MSALLTSRQAEELHKSLIAYLASADHPNAALALRQELDLPESSFDTATTKKYEGLLEKKWTSVVRLQKKIMDLETRCTSLQHELDNATPTSLAARKNHDPATWLPKAPARHTLQSHRAPITSVAFHPLFSSLASASEDYVDYGGPRGNTLLASCSSDLTIKLWDASDEYKNIRTLPGHDHSVSAVRFIPSGAAGAPLSGNLLASASRDKTIRIWDATTGYCLRTLRGHNEWVRSLSPTPEGRFLLSTSSDQTARLWDLSQPDSKALKQTLAAHDHVIETCAIAPASSYNHLAAMAGQKKPPPASSTAEYLATGGRDKLIKLHTSAGVLIKTLTGHDNWIRGLAFHPGGKYLLSCSDDKTIRCWDLSQEGKCVRTLEVAGHFLSCLRWAPSVVKEGDASAGAVNGNGVNGTEKGKGTGQTEQIRCLLACGSVDLNVRVFSA
ncbi:Lissencephaly-1 [Oleoguttula sp. CCFEE 5521]